MTFEAKKYHQTLANYFLSKPHYLIDTNKKNPNIRKLIEQPWNLYCLKDPKGYYYF